jgi:hypothetical protein
MEEKMLKENSTKSCLQDHDKERMRRRAAKKSEEGEEEVEMRREMLPRRKDLSQR